ncbi:putative defense protein Hdd11 [Amphiura filiformis]|uniref:putative defense protein Hdd11 n=1 Tax=Amphiura filiformis TaxID=82378 RepID=UPI003B21F60F
MNALLGLNLAFCVVTIAIAYPSGPPINHFGFRSVCTDMNPKPGHTREPQVNTPSPYKITLSQDSYANDLRIQVNVTGKNIRQRFAGFMLQARKVGRKMPLGTFSHFSMGTQGLHCAPGNDTTWGHSNADHKLVASAMWSPPKWDNGEIQFVATVVQGPNIVYWMDVKSDIVVYMGPSRPPTTMESGQTVVRSSSWSCLLSSILVLIITSALHETT